MLNCWNISNACCQKLALLTLALLAPSHLHKIHQNIQNTTANWQVTQNHSPKSCSLHHHHCEHFKPPERNYISMTSFLNISQRPSVSFLHYSVLNVPEKFTASTCKHFYQVLKRKVAIFCEILKMCPHTFVCLCFVLFNRISISSKQSWYQGSNLMPDGSSYSWQKGKCFQF